MKKLFLWMLALTMVQGLTSCSADDDETPVDQRTVIVYMSGDNSLSPVESLDILEMQDGASGIPQNSNLVVFIDRDVMGENPFIIRIKTDYKADTLYKYTSDFYASDPEKFSEVLKRITTLCPAKEYGLVLWGHGSGWVVDSDTIAQKRAYGVDHNKWMNITQLAGALKDLKNQNVLPKLSYIFADCCNMVNAETGYELRELTDYLIGSPCEIPEYGAPYQLVVPHLFRSGSALYKGIIDTYYDYYTDFDHLTGVEKITWPYMKDGYSVPLSVIDTKYISDLADMTHDMLEHTIGGYPLYPESPDLEDIAFYWYGDVRMMYDMRAVMERLLSEDDFKTWDKTYQLAVPYYRMSMKWMTIWASLKNTFSSFNPDLKYGCVSMFIPKEGSYYTYGKVPYNITSLNFGWNRVMDWKRFGWE
jgi:hypothetical protein